MHSLQWKNRGNKPTKLQQHTASQSHWTEQATNKAECKQQQTLTLEMSAGSSEITPSVGALLSAQRTTQGTETSVKNKTRVSTMGRRTAYNTIGRANRANKRAHRRDRMAGISRQQRHCVTAAEGRGARRLTAEDVEAGDDLLQDRRVPVHRQILPKQPKCRHSLVEMDAAIHTRPRDYVGGDKQRNVHGPRQHRARRATTNAGS